MSKQALLLYRKDVQTVTGRGIKYAQQVITEIWVKKNKPRQRWVTIPELCDHFQLREEDVNKILGR